MLEFENTEIPAETRAPKVNEYLPLVEDMVANGGARAVTLSYKTPEDEKVVTALVSAVQRAGREVEPPVTVRKRLDVDETAGTVKVTFWLVDRITRKRENGDAEADAPTPAPAKKTAAKK